MALMATISPNRDANDCHAAYRHGAPDTGVRHHELRPRSKHSSETS